MLFLLVCFLFPVIGSAGSDAGDLSLIQAQNVFSTKIFRVLFFKDPNVNVFFSPYSIYRMLTTIYVASSGKTTEEIEDLLQFNASKPDKNNIIKAFFDDIPENPSAGYELTTSDRVFIAPELAVKKDAAAQFAGKISVFKTEDNRTAQVNDWVSKATKGMIQKLVQRVESGKTVLFANAAYFKGTWKIIFKLDSSEKSFQLSNGDVTKTLFMSIDKGPFKTIIDEKLKAQAISLPYKGEDISMIIILPLEKPKKNTTPPIIDVVKKLTGANFKEILLNLQNGLACKTSILIPKFESEESYDLKEVLQRYGGNDFVSHPLDLSPLLEHSPPMHRARVKVHENGTEAAGGSSGGGGRTLPQPCSFQADHPFVYIIYNNKNHFIYFMGILNHPK